MDYTVQRRHSIIDRYKNGNSTLEDTLQDLAKTGLCPGLISVVNDDFGNWALSFEGVQGVPSTPGEPDFISTTFLIDKHKWHKTIRDAVIHCFDELPEDETKPV